MPATTIKIRSSGGGEFDCYLAMPAGDGKRPAIVLAAAVHGVDKDIRDLADEFAGARLHRRRARPVLALDPGPARAATTSARRSARSRGSRRSRPASPTWSTRSRICARCRSFNGRAATMGFCYGGPYAILGPKRLGYDAGISCHGTQHARLHRRARGRHRAGLHHLGRPGSRRAGRGARRLSRRCRRACRTSRCTSSPACCTAT